MHILQNWTLLWKSALISCHGMSLLRHFRSLSLSQHQFRDHGNFWLECGTKALKLGSLTFSDRSLKTMQRFLRKFLFQIQSNDIATTWNMYPRCEEFCKISYYVNKQAWHKYYTKLFFFFLLENSNMGTARIFETMFTQKQKTVFT
jgi:hypothetical protein